MADIVLIHGIGQEQEGPASLEARWIPALADGIIAGGHPELAQKIWPIDCERSIDVRMAAYGDLFLDRDSQGDITCLDDLNGPSRALAESLASEWLLRAADRGQPSDRETASLELGYLHNGQEDMGAREEAARAMINSISRLRWFAPFGMALGERFVVKSLIQVSRYFNEPDLREQILNRVLAHVGPETKAIVGHSLGSVLAYEVASSYLTFPLPLLVTMGSPLGLRTIIYDRIQPRPPVYPSKVRCWVNVADRNDLVAAEPQLADLFPNGNGSVGVTEGRIQSGWLNDEAVNNGPRPHEGEYYLRKRAVGRPLASAFAAEGDSA